MKTTLSTLTLLLSLLTGSAYAAGGDEVNNGGGAAEKNISYAFLHLTEYLDTCLSVSWCQLDQYEKQTLKRLKDNWPAEIQAKTKISFESERKRPGFFILDGEPKMAKTGLVTGSPIYVNTDMIYYRDENQRIVPLSVVESVALLVHELGHHLNITEHWRLDLLGQKVSMALSRRVQELPLDPAEGKIKLWAFNQFKSESYPQVLLYLGDQVIDVSKQVKNALKCTLVGLPSPIPGVPDLSISLSDPSSSIMHNIHWTRAKLDDGEAKFAIEANLSSVCKKNHTLFTNPNHYQMEIKFELSKDDDGHWQLEELKARQFYRPWWMILRLPDFWGSSLDRS